MLISVLIYILIVSFSFVLLARITNEYFIPSLDAISKKLKMSSDMAGATLMAIGSSAPELAIAIFAVLRPGEHSEIGVGTIVGSAVFNILVIIGVVAVIKKTLIYWQPIARYLFFYLLTLFILYIIFKNGNITLIEAIVFISSYIVYVVFIYVYNHILKYKDDVENENETEKIESSSSEVSKILNPVYTILDKIFPAKNNFLALFIISIILISGLSLALVESTIYIAKILDIPEVFIAITVLAIGSSIPDLLASAIVAKQGRGEMAISNAIGSNIFDILIGIGLPSLLFFMGTNKTIMVNNQHLLPSIILLFGSIILILIVFIINKWKIGPWAGISLLIIYLIYIAREIWLL